MLNGVYLQAFQEMTRSYRSFSDRILAITRFSGANESIPNAATEQEQH
jgi:hypothetical protein